MVSILLASEALLSPADRGLAYGDGLFETLRVSSGRAELVCGHRRRMLKGAAQLGIPFAVEDFDRALALGLNACPGKTGVIKLLLTRGSGGRGYRPPESPQPLLLVSVHELPARPSPAGVKAVISTVPLSVNPLLAGLKTLNRLEQVLASREIPADAYEAVMLNEAAELVEGTRTNLLYLWKDQWHMPPLRSLAVAGVMLEYVGQCLAQSGETITEQALTKPMLTDASFGGLLLLNSVAGPVPVTRLDALQLPVSGRLATITGLTDFPLEAF